MSAKTIAISMLLVLCACALVAGCSSDDNTTAPNTVNAAPILPPQNVIVTKSVDGTVSITWAANTQSNLSGYKVYRNDLGSGSVATLTPNPITVTFYLDDTATDGSYEYRVTSVSNKGDESGYTPRTIVIGDDGGSKFDREN